LWLLLGNQGKSDHKKVWLEMVYNTEPAKTKLLVVWRIASGDYTKNGSLESDKVVNLSDFHRNNFLMTLI
jgi:hypothetical protein